LSLDRHLPPNRMPSSTENPPASITVNPKVCMTYIAGADCESKDALGRTPLLAAVSRGHLGAAKHLIAGGADDHARDMAGDGLLEIAPRGFLAQQMAALEGMGMGDDALVSMSCLIRANGNVEQAVVKIARL